MSRGAGAGPALPLDITDAAAARPRRRPRLVALDLDGTCLDDQQRLAPRTRGAVRACVRGGIDVVVASGRMYRSALPWAREMQVTAPLVCYQGALVRAMPDPGDPVIDGVPTGRLLEERGLDAGTARDGIAVARQHGWHRQAYRDDRLLCEEDRPEAHLYARIAQVDIHFVDDLAAAVSAGSTKLVCVVDEPAETDRCESTMRHRLADRARVTRSLPPFVEIFHPGAGKGAALRRICGEAGVDLDEVVAIGDAPNDRDMLEAAGFRIAVRGAHPDLLAIVDATCAPPQEAGVADVLERLGLTG